METREYNLSDGAMLTFAAMHRGLFIEYQADFVAFDSDFASPAYETDWQAAIAASLSFGTAETRDDQLSIHTAEVNEALKAIALKVKDVKYFVYKTFPPEVSEVNQGIVNKFGFNDYQRVYGNQQQLGIFMKNMHKVATQHAIALAAKGFTAAKLAQINMVTDNFLALDMTQDVFNKQSSKETDQRVKVHNTTWGFSRNVRHAAEVIYAEDPVMFNMFLYPRRTEAPEVFNLVGNASAMGTGAAVVGATVFIPELGLTTTTDEDGNYGLAEVANGAYTLRITAAGFQSANIPFTMSTDVIPTVVNAMLIPLP
jgi:hypothetical protein